MITNKWAADFIKSFAGSQDRNITARQMGIFEKYAEVKDRRRGTYVYTGQTEEYKFEAIQYWVGTGSTFYRVTVVPNNDAILAELSEELKRLETAMDADISDEEYDKFEAQYNIVLNRFLELRTGF